MLQKNAILFSRLDREDFWVCGGLVFKVQNTATYEDAYNEIKHLLESPELIEYIIIDNCLKDDLFEEDETFKFARTYLDSGLVYVFVNEDGYDVEHRFSIDFVCVNN